MPNTLAHAGAQGLLTRTVLPDADLKWVYLGCIIPDFSWILQRAALTAVPGIDPHLLRSYVIIQASLLGCLICSAAVALVARKTWTVFAVLGGNAVLHLVIDAMQTKWGNGVHFFAPVSWETINWGLFWPESFPTYVLTAFGLVYVGWYWQSSVKESLGLTWPGIWRLTGILVLLAGYFAGPLFLLRGPIEADAHSLEVLRETQERVGRQLELDRAGYVSTQSGHFLKYYGERVQVEELKVASPATVSIRGVFVDRHKIRITKLHVHPGGLRDYPSYLGLALVVAVWGTAALKSWKI